MMMSKSVDARDKPRRFPSPWTVEDTASCFVVRDNEGQALAHVYYEGEPGRPSAAKLLAKDEARRIAINIAKLPDLLLGGAKALFLRPLWCRSATPSASLRLCQINGVF